MPTSPEPPPTPPPSLPADEVEPKGRKSEKKGKGGEKETDREPDGIEVSSQEKAPAAEDDDADDNYVVSHALVQRNASFHPGKLCEAIPA